ncbi:glucose PTS transporter subunit IIA [Amedibacillus sp. YH-ame6]
MKSNLFGIMQRVGRSFMLPIALLPIAGLFLGLGSCLTNEATIASLHLEGILGQGMFLHDVLQVTTKVGSTIFNNLPIIFAASVALGMAKKEREIATLSAIVAFLVMHTTINGMLVADGRIVDGKIASDVVDGTINFVCGIQSLEMGVFGGILVGLGVAYLHNRFYRIELPSVLSFFEGTRFVPIISAVVYLFVGFLMYYIWPFFQNMIFSAGDFITQSGYIGTFVFGCIKRILNPFGLHHVFYLPFWQTVVGGSMEVNGTMIYGGQNIFFAQLADPNTIHFSADATRYFTGEFLFMIFGLPGAGLAMYRCCKKEYKKIVGSFLLTACLTSVLTGITEPVEFMFLFSAPILYVIHVIFVGSAYMVAQILNITIGLTFSGGLLDFIVFGVLQGNDKTSWYLAIPVGLFYFCLYYFVFKFMIVRFNLKTIGRGGAQDLLALTIHNKKDKQESDSYVIDKQAQRIVVGVGGRDNISNLDSCITKLRLTINDSAKVNKALLKQAGAAAIIMHGNGLQIIFGPKASMIRTNIKEYLLHTTKDEMEEEQVSLCLGNVEIGCIVDGEVMAIEESCDQMFAQKLIGDGVMVKPNDGLIVAPCEGVVTMIYPTKHAIGLLLENGIELLLHFGTDTVNLKGEGFELLVRVGQTVSKGDVLWNADLRYIQKEATCENILVVFTNLSDDYKIEKTYKSMSRGEVMMKLIRD